MEPNYRSRHEERSGIVCQPGNDGVGRSTPKPILRTQIIATHSIPTSYVWVFPTKPKYPENRECGMRGLNIGNFGQKGTFNETAYY